MKETVLKKMKRRQEVCEWAKVILGALMMALSLNMFFEPVGMVVGGVTGVGIIIKELTSKMDFEIPLAVTNLVINIPLLIAGMVIKGRRFMLKTVVSTVLLSGFLTLTEGIRLGVEDPILITVFGGVLLGAGTGLVLAGAATTGGTDLFAALVQTKLRHISTIRLLQIIDSLVVLGGAVVFGLSTALYAVIGLYISTMVGDHLIEGFHRAKAVYIITPQWAKIAQEILRQLERGVTGLESRGMYTGEERKMLFCVVSVKELIKIKKIVYGEDSRAFLIVSDAREVLGEGFLNYQK